MRHFTLSPVNREISKISVLRKDKEVCYSLKTNFVNIIILFLMVICSNNIYSQKISQSKVPITITDSLNSIKSLTNEIQQILSDKNLKNTQYGIAIYSLDQNKYFFKRNSTNLITPASTTKLFTTISALNKYSSKFLMKTSVYTDGLVDKDGILNGNLYIVGRGDALLSLSEIEYLADQIRKSGIAKVVGNVYADNSYFDEITDRFIYSGDKEEVQHVSPVTALSINNNTITVLVSSGSKSGNPVSVQVFPSSSAIKISNKAKVGITRELPSKSKSKQKIKKRKHRGDEEEEEIIPIHSEFQSSNGISIKSELFNNHTQYFYITGNLVPNRTVSFKYNIAKPSIVVAGALLERLISGGVAVKGSIGERKLDDIQNQNSIKQLAEFGRPLTDMLYLVNKNSDNYLAENVFKIIGAKSTKLKNTAKASQEYITNLLDSLQIQCPDCKLYDGCGLSRRNAVTPESFIELLKITSKKPYGRAFDSTLSVAGIDGTLRKRMIGSAADNNVHAKTGTHKNVSALVGYVNSLDGERLIFAFMFRGPNVGYYKRIEDELCKSIASFFYFNEEK